MATKKSMWVLFGILVDLGLDSWVCHSGGGRDPELQDLQLCD